MRWVCSVLLFLMVGSASAHPIPKFKLPSQAFAKLKQAGLELEAYKKKLDAEGHYSCCIKKPKASQTEGCQMCAIKNGSCACGANLALGKGVCGECKGGWVNGQGAMKLKNTPFTSAKEIPVMPSEHQAMPGVKQNPEDPHLKAYRGLMLESKKVLVSERRFNCCVGQGGCDECASEQYCGCAVNLTSKPQGGVCGQCLDGQHAGHSRVPGVPLASITVMPMTMEMRGAITGSMAQEGSGTAWIPGLSPMYMRELGRKSGFDTYFMGLGTVNFADAGGRRGESQFFTNSMAMWMARKEDGTGVLSFRGMLSADAITNGQRGYPNLFQTGETAHGKPLRDRQHPHDLFMELSATYTKTVGKDAKVFLYLAPIGEPALGTAAFQHRPTAWDNPEAPIGHHWNDGTHITYGVITAGLNFADKWKIDGSIFNGREPNENRFDFDPVRLNSYAGRLTFNPSGQWSFGTSYGFLKSPEAVTPNENAHRLTANAFYNTTFRDSNLAMGLIFGRNIHSGSNSDAWNLEGAWTRGKEIWFGRWEQVQKDELVDVPAGSYRVNKLTLGYTRDITTRGGFDFGLGGYIGCSCFPSALDSFYGSGPVGFGLFLRIRPSRM